MAVAAGVVVTVGGVGAWSTLADPGTDCSSGREDVSIAVAPELEPVVAQAQRLLRARQEVDPCLDVSVRAIAPASVARSIAAGPTQAAIWIPDSSTWLADLTLPAGAVRPSIARSPVVLAVPVRRAEALGWPEHPLTVPGLLADVGARPVRLHLAEPAQSALTAISLWAVQRTVEGADEGLGRLTVLLRSSVTASATPAEALAAAADDGVRAVVAASEQAVWAHDSAAPPEQRLAPGYLPGRATLDYPFVVLAANPLARDHASRLEQFLHGPEGRALLSSLGFRAPTGEAPTTMSRALGQEVPALNAESPVDATAVAGAVRSAAALHLDSRLLVLIDVSTPFTRPMAADGRSGLDLATQAAQAGLNLLPDDSHVGAWAYARHMREGRPYARIARIRPLDQLTDAGNQRQALAEALTRLEPSTQAGAGLHDTLLAAVARVRARWKPGMVNAVVVIGHGKDDGAGIGIGELVAGLVATQDPQRPVPVISIVLGSDGDTQALQAVAAVTGGATYTVEDPKQLGAVFLDAIGQRTCRPMCPATPRSMPDDASPDTREETR